MRQAVSFSSRIVNAKIWLERTNVAKICTVVGIYYGILSVELKQHAGEQWRTLTFRIGF